MRASQYSACNLLRQVRAAEAAANDDNRIGDVFLMRAIGIFLEDCAAGIFGDSPEEVGMTSVGKAPEAPPKNKGGRPKKNLGAPAAEPSLPLSGTSPTAAASSSPANGATEAPASVADLVTGP